MASSCICQVIKFSVSRSFQHTTSAAFTSFRETTKQLGVLEAYAGKELHKPGNLFCVLEWPQDLFFTNVQSNKTYLDQLKTLDSKENPEIWTLSLKDRHGLRKALQAPVFQFCCVWLRKDVDPQTLAGPLLKTFTDCYEAPGFTGGDWGPDLDSQGRINWYLLGWESRKLHDEYMASDLFWVEVNKLELHMEKGFASFIYLKPVE